MRNRRKTDGNENTVKKSTEDGQEYKQVEELTEYGQKYEHSKMFEERCGIKQETITMVSLLFINLVINCHRLALCNCVFSTRVPTLSYTSHREPLTIALGSAGTAFLLITVHRDLSNILVENGGPRPVNRARRCQRRYRQRHLA